MNNWLRGISLFILLVVLHLPASAHAQEMKISLSFQSANIETVMQEIKRQTQYDFVYNAQQVDLSGK